MILVDSSVWVDYFRGTGTAQTNKLNRLLGNELLATGDLILAEVLQGIDSDREFNQVRKMLDSLELVELGGRAIAIQAAKNFRTLRARGVTIRKTIDTLIATWCIDRQCELLHDDADFKPFTKYLGLRVVI